MAVGEIRVTKERTGYGSPDNTPAGYNIAYPDGMYPDNGQRPPASNAWGAAFGRGTWRNPYVAAGDPAVYPNGTQVYYPDLQRYFRFKDTCDKCIELKNGRIDVWVGGNLNSTTEQIEPVAESITKLTADGGAVAYLHPKSDYPVTEGVIAGPAHESGVISPPAPIGESRIIVPILGYGWQQNNNSRFIDFPLGQGGIHTQAGGLGTFDDPSTARANPNDWDIGEKVYIPAPISRYVIIEANRNIRDGGIQLWVGGTEVAHPADQILASIGRVSINGPVIRFPLNGRPVGDTRQIYVWYH